MNIKKRIICLFKGHDFRVVLTGEFELQMNGECYRCRYRFPHKRVISFLLDTWNKEITQC